MMQFSSRPWWMTDAYDDPAEYVPALALPALHGPQGPALVSLWNDGTTAKGWGRETFMDVYQKLGFAMNRVLHGYRKGKWNYAWVMRGSRLVCIDIDGKNGGFDHATQLGFLPPTVAETSKSGNGYHLFYEVDDDWDPAEGFATYRDHIGIVTGVDIRGTGCVYHYPSQRWNDRPLAKLPEHLDQKLRQRHQLQQQQASVIAKTLELDKDEIAMLHHDLLEELAKPIPVGKRNNTLFAIGSKLKLAQVPDWETSLSDRAIKAGLDANEIDKLIRNISAYGG